MERLMTLNDGFLSKLKRFLADEPRTSHMIVHRLTELGRPFLMRSDLREA